MSNMGYGEYETTDFFGDQEETDADIESIEEEGYGDDEAISVAERRKRRAQGLARRRANARRAALKWEADRRARARHAIGRRGVPPTTKAAVRTTQAEVRALDLKNEVRADKHQSELEDLQKQLRRTQTGTVAGLVLGQAVSTFEDRFGFLKLPAAKAAPGIANLLFLPPAKHGRGFWSDIRVQAAAVIGAIFVAHKLTEPKPTAVQRVEITPPSPTVDSSTTASLAADAFDGSGKTISGASFSWDSTDKAVATVTPDANTATAKVTETAGATKGQTTFITASADGVTDRVQVTVTS